LKIIVYLTTIASVEVLRARMQQAC